MARRLAVLTTGRQDWGLLHPLCVELSSDDGFELLLIAGGMACSESFGSVPEQIRADGFHPVRELAWPVVDTDPSIQMSRALAETATAIQELQPWALVLLGDRLETAAAALAATLNRLPLVHLFGGEETQGAFDDCLRHAITKLSHLHLVSHRVYARRVVQLGENPDTVHVVGSLSLDNILSQQLSSREELEEHLGVRLEPPVGLVTLHPTTLADAREDELAAVSGALEACRATWVITLPNSDPGGAEIRRGFLALASKHENIVAVPSLGAARYLGLLRIANVVVGNSSSGVTEAPLVGVPTVNIGDRQRGRIRFESVIDVPPNVDAIVQAIRRVFGSSVRVASDAPQKEMGDGRTAGRIRSILASWRAPDPPRKSFYDIPFDGVPDVQPVRRAQGRSEA